MRVVVVGCGRMGRERAKAAASFGVEAVGLLDEDASRAESLANEVPRAEVLESPEALFEGAFDAIFICTPPFCRGPFELRAITRGIPFLVEKPIGISASQVQSVIEGLRNTCVLTAVGYMNRYRNSVSYARSLLGGRKIIGISAHWVGKKYGVPWWGVLGQSGGPFNEQATHHMDLFRYLGGGVEILRVAAHAPAGVETTVLVAIRLSGGGLGNFLYSCEAKDKDIFVIVETTDGVLELRGWDLDLVRNTIDGSVADPEVKPIFEKETHLFLEAVAGGGDNLIRIDFNDAYQTQILMDKAMSMIKPPD